VTAPEPTSDLTPTGNRPLRVCYFGAYRAGYARNRLMIEGLRRNGVEVIECHERLWHGVEDRVQAVESSWKSPSFWRRVLGTYARLIRKYYAMRPDYDVMVVGYPGQFDVFLARLLSWQRRRPLAWDILMSIYLVAVERRLDRKSPGVVFALHLLERAGLQLPDVLVMDTEQYAAWFGRVCGVPRHRFQFVPIGADTDGFLPEESDGAHSQDAAGSERVFRVLYYGTFIENHGVATIMEAARLLRSHGDVEFELIGDGPERAMAEAMIREHELANVHMVGWLNQAGLRTHIASANLCLGVFGATTQSMITVHNKIKECMAMGKPVLTGTSPAVRDAFEHGKHLYLCGRADPLALAAAIVELQQRPRLREEMAQAGRELVRSEYTVECNGERFKSILVDVATRMSQEHLC